MSLRPLLYSALFAASLAIVACGSSATTNVTGPTASRCQAALTNSSSGFSAAGGTGSVKISVARECAWSATTPSPWIAITAGQQGQGDGTVSYKVAENGDPVNRSASIVVGDQHVDIGQQAAECRYTLSAPSQPLSATGGQATVDVRTHSACGWTAAADAAWVSLTPSSGKGDGVVRVDAAPNAGNDRVVTLTVGTSRVTMTQDHAPIPPQPTPGPTNPGPTNPNPPNPGPTNPGPTNPGPTNPPPAPTPQPITLTGKPDDVRGSCPALTITLKGYQVRTSAATEFRRGPCKDVNEKKEITVTGVLQDPTRKVVDASVVEVKK